MEDQLNQVPSELAKVRRKLASERKTLEALRACSADLKARGGDVGAINRGLDTLAAEIQAMEAFLIEAENAYAAKAVALREAAIDLERARRELQWATAQEQRTWRRAEIDGVEKGDADGTSLKRQRGD